MAYALPNSRVAFDKIWGKTGVKLDKQVTKIGVNLYGRISLAFPTLPVDYSTHDTPERSSTHIWFGMSDSSPNLRFHPHHP